MLRRLAGLPLHPFLIAATSVVSLYAANLRETFFSDMAPSLVVALCGTLAVYLVCAAAFRGFTPKAALLASAFVAVSLYHRDLFGRLNVMLDGGYSMVVTLPAALLALAAAALLLARLPGRLTGPHLIANGMALAFFAMPAAQAGLYEWRNAPAATVAEEAIDSAPALQASAPAELPDIYYFIFDRYASHDVLAEHYDYDDGDLIAYLEEAGFYVARDASANYFKTAYSVASTFHMDYVNFLGQDPRVAPSNWRPLYDMLDDHRVARFLKSQGYSLIQLGSWWRGTYNNTFADENHPFGFNEFEMIYWRTTILRPLLHGLFPGAVATRRLAWDNGQCQRVPKKIATVKAIAERPEPTFTFAHFLVPHGPEVFTTDGACLSQGQAHARGEARGYLDQVAYSGAMIRDMVESLLSHDGPKPIIVVAADEGPYPPGQRGSWREATEDQIRIKTGILNAFYFPGGDYSALYPGITPVNTFRAVFNAHFDTRLPLLPDRVYGTPDIVALYDFFDVTDIVRGRPPVDDLRVQHRPAGPSPVAR